MFLTPLCLQQSLRSISYTSWCFYVVHPRSRGGGQYQKKGLQKKEMEWSLEIAHPTLISWQCWGIKPRILYILSLSYIPNSEITLLGTLLWGDTYAKDTQLIYIIESKRLWTRLRPWSRWSLILPKCRNHPLRTIYHRYLTSISPIREFYHLII